MSQKKGGRDALALIWRKAWRSAMLPGIVGTTVRVGANLILLPLILKLSIAEQALWWVFVSLGAFGNLADFGFGASIPRVYNYLYAGAEDFDSEGVRPATGHGEPNFKGLGRLLVTVRSLYIKISLGAMGLLTMVGTLVLLRPAAESGDPHRVWLEWGFFLLATGYNLATFHWVLAVQGINRMRELQMVYMYGGVSFVATVGLLMLLHCGLASMVVATFVKGFVMHGRCRQIYRAAVPETGERIEVDPGILRKLWPNARKFGVLSLGAYALASGPLLICSQLFGKEVVASYGLTASIGTFLTSFATLWLTVKWPQIAILRAQGKLHEMAVLFARRLLLAAATFVALGLIILFGGNDLLHWLGKQTKLLPGPYLAFYLFYLLEQLFYFQFGTLAYTENVVPFYRVGVYTGLGACLLSLLMTPVYGLWGLLLAPWISETVCSAWFTVRRGFQGQPLAPREFIMAGVRGSL